MAISLMYRLALLALALAAAAVVVLDACSRETASLPPPDQVHVVRGMIVQLPDPAKPVQSLQIHHEPIEAYVRADGSLGMNAMVMPFNPAKDLDLSGFAVGDVVEFRWDVRRREKGPSLVTSMKKLPAETKLNLGRAGGG